MFDLTGRAKWDVWNLTGKTYQARAVDVESRYLEIAQTYGWVEGATHPPKTASTDRKEDGLDGLDDEGEHASSSAGLGITVSSIVSPPPDEDELRTIHGLALSDNAQGLATYLRENPDADVDAVDEYVCLLPLLPQLVVSQPCTCRDTLRFTSLLIEAMWPLYRCYWIKAPIEISRCVVVKLDRRRD
jgi:hypothetical protein